MSRLKQQWVFDYHDFNDRNPAYDEEFHKIQQNWDCSNDSHINFDLDSLGEGIEEEYPLLVQAMKDEGITSCIVLIWW